MPRQPLRPAGQVARGHRLGGLGRGGVPYRRARRQLDAVHAAVRRAARQGGQGGQAAAATRLGLHTHWPGAGTHRLVREAVGRPPGARPPTHPPAHPPSLNPPSSVHPFSCNPSPSLDPSPDQACTCCWTHGIWNRDSTRKRHSITLRAYDVDWGRHEARRGGDHGDEAGGS